MFRVGAHDFRQNVTGAGCPDEGLWSFVVGEDKEMDCGDQLGNTVKYFALEPILTEVSKKAEQHIHPGRAGRGEMQMKAGSLGQPLLYLAMVLDLFGRRVVGSSLRPHMQSSLVTDALRMAWFRRAPDEGVILRSDRGSHYCGHEFQSAVADYTMKS